MLSPSYHEAFSALKARASASFPVKDRAKIAAAEARMKLVAAEVEVIIDAAMKQTGRVITINEMTEEQLVYIVLHYSAETHPN